MTSWRRCAHTEPTSETVKPDAARTGSLIRQVESIAKPAETAAAAWPFLGFRPVGRLPDERMAASRDLQQPGGARAKRRHPSRLERCRVGPATSGRRGGSGAMVRTRLRGRPGFSAQAAVGPGRARSRFEHLAAGCTDSPSPNHQACERSSCVNFDRYQTEYVTGRKAIWVWESSPGSFWVSWLAG